VWAVYLVASSLLSTKVHQTRWFLELGRPAVLEQALVSGIISWILGDPMQQPSGKMRELRTALTVALGLAVASFGTAIVAASYIAR
jgi:hypothetical protein